VFDFPVYKRNTNQNYTKISSHPSQNGHLQEQKQQQMLVGIQSDRNPSTLLVGMQIMEYGMEIP
jgi:hypothetical protein